VGIALIAIGYFYFHNKLGSPPQTARNETKQVDEFADSTPKNPPTLEGASPVSPHADSGSKFQISGEGTRPPLTPTHEPTPSPVAITGTTPTHERTGLSNSPLALPSETKATTTGPIGAGVGAGSVADSTHLNPAPVSVVPPTPSVETETLNPTTPSPAGSSTVALPPNVEKKPSTTDRLGTGTLGTSGTSGTPGTKTETALAMPHTPMPQNPAGTASESNTTASSGQNKSATAAATTATTGPRIHVVEKGDTYYSLAVKYLGHGKYAKLIQEANPGRDGSKIHIGQKIKIPDLPNESAGTSGTDKVGSDKTAGKTAATGTKGKEIKETLPPIDPSRAYTVQPGDGWRSMARRFLSREEDYPKLYELNKERVNSNPDLLRPGMVIELPPGAKVPPPKVEPAKPTPMPTDAKSTSSPLSPLSTLSTVSTSNTPTNNNSKESAAGKEATSATKSNTTDVKNSSTDEKKSSSASSTSPAKSSTVKSGTSAKSTTTKTATAGKATTNTKSTSGTPGTSGTTTKKLAN
ncbi:MAG: LysM peptidoglycan-binding domain-containing protein, partial [Phycisphaerae bacterium]|nr:LysM peptidoglycan-binding domain-containing protein [Phycisphaerae bacterium]